MKYELNFAAAPFEGYSATEDEQLHGSLNLTSEWDESAESLFGLEEEDEFRIHSFPPHVQEAFNMGPLAWPVAVRRAINAGIADLNDLTNVVFFMHHPERLYRGQGTALHPKEPHFAKLRDEWLAWRTLVKPMLTHLPKAPPGSEPQYPEQTLKYGILGGMIGSGYLVKRAGVYHTGIDVSPSTKKGGGAEDPRRGLPVYLTVRRSIDIKVLNAVKVADSKQGPIRSGLDIPGQGAATLQGAKVIKRLSHLEPDNGYGSLVGLACRYAYTKTDGSSASFTLYIEYWHLITRETLPYPGEGSKIPLDVWIAAGKGQKMGFGAEMRVGNEFTPDKLTAASPLLIGYLGATRWPHVHIHVNYKIGVAGYLFYPRIDPTVMIT